MDDFSEKMQLLLADFGKGRKMVLSTSAEGLVSSRMMSVVQLDGIFYLLSRAKYGANSLLK